MFLVDSIKKHVRPTMNYLAVTQVIKPNRYQTLIEEEDEENETAEGHNEEALPPLQLLEALLLLSRIPVQRLGYAVHPALTLPTGRQDIGKGISRG